MAHLKRYSMPDMWPLPKKQKTWVARPIPGPHALKECMPLQVIIRDLLKYAQTAAEAKKIIKSGGILVDKKARKETGFPVGLMDVIEIPESKEVFVVLPEKNGLALKKADSPDRKLCRIRSRKIVKKGLMQLILHDGRTMIFKTKEGSEHKPGDSIVISLPDQKILKHYRLEKGAPAFIFAGKNRGEKGKIKEIKSRKTMLEVSSIILKTDSKEIETLKEYVMVGEI